LLLPDEPVEEAEQLLPDPLIHTVRRFLKLVPEGSLERAPREEAIDSMLVEHIDSILEERASCLLDHAVKGVEKEAKLVYRITLLLIGGCLACSCRA
jgi:hypothetical protein